jgi:hypothetical protein
MKTLNLYGFYFFFLKENCLQKLNAEEAELRKELEIEVKKQEEMVVRQVEMEGEKIKIEVFVFFEICVRI